MPTARVSQLFIPTLKEAPADAVVEVFQGATCGTQVSLGGPSADTNYNENHLSTAITAAGPIWVEVTYSSFGFSSANYTMDVTLE